MQTTTSKHRINNTLLTYIIILIKTSKIPKTTTRDVSMC